jgi:hypothetical protein
MTVVEAVISSSCICVVDQHGNMVWESLSKQEQRVQYLYLQGVNFLGESASCVFTSNLQVLGRSRDGVLGGIDDWGK